MAAAWPQRPYPVRSRHLNDIAGRVDAQTPRTARTHAPHAAGLLVVPVHHTLAASAAQPVNRPVEVLIVSTATFSIVKASAEDAEALRSAVSEVYARAFSLPPWNEQWTLDEAWEAVAGKLQLGADLFLAKTKDGRVVGLGLGILLGDGYPGADELARFGLVPGCYYCIDMAVCESMQRRGVGRQLLLARESRARELGAAAVGMRTRPDNVSCIRCYEAQGYTARGTYSAVTGHVESPRVVHVKNL